MQMSFVENSLSSIKYLYLNYTWINKAALATLYVSCLLSQHSGSRGRQIAEFKACVIYRGSSSIQRKKKKAVLLLFHPCHVLGNVIVTFITSSFSSVFSCLPPFLFNPLKEGPFNQVWVQVWSQTRGLLGVRPLRRTDSSLPCSQTCHGSSLGLRRTALILAGSFTGLILVRQTEFLNS